jgi:hypothetical protein
MKPKTAALVLLLAFVVISLGLLVRRVFDVYPPEIYYLKDSISLRLSHLVKLRKDTSVNVRYELETVGASRFEVRTEAPELFQAIYWPKTWFNLFDARVFVNVNLKDGRPISYDLHTIVRAP